MSGNLNDNNRKDTQMNTDGEIFISRSEKRKAEKKEEVKPKKKKSLLRTQKRLICILLVFTILLGASAVIVHKIVSRNIWYDTKGDGQKYYVTQRQGSYVITDTDDYVLNMTEDKKHYVTLAGNVIDVDAKSGEVSYYAYVDTEDNEQIGNGDRIIMFPHTEKASVQKIEVHNQKGSYTFERQKLDDGTTDFVIKGHEAIPYSPELFAQLVVTCGYTLSMMKFTSDDVNKYGLAEYGLVDEVRVDEDGNEYNYSPTWYKLTDIKGNTHKVIVGDPIPSNAGYYVQYAGRNAVYVLSSAGMDNCLLADIESLCTPVLNLPMSMNNYFFVENFIVWNTVTDFDDPFKTKPLVTFEYLDLSVRQNTEFQYTPYYSFNELLSEDDDGKETKIDVTPKISNVNEYTIDTLLQTLYLLSTRESGVNVVDIDLTESNIKDKLKEYGLDKPAYRMFFTFQDTMHDIAFSEKTERGTYYVLSGIYDMIVEVSAEHFRFIEWKDAHWISGAIVPFNIAFLKTLNVKSNSFDYTFLCDNSNTDTSEGISSKNLLVNLKDPNKVIDVSQFRKLFQVLIYTNYEGDLELTKEEEDKLISDPSKFILSFRYTTAGRDYEFKFYRYSERKAYVTLNGVGGRYVKSTQIDKIISDTQKVLTGETIEVESKY